MDPCAHRPRSPRGSHARGSLGPARKGAGRAWNANAHVGAPRGLGRTRARGLRYRGSGPARSGDSGPPARELSPGPTLNPACPRITTCGSYLARDPARSLRRVGVLCESARQHHDDGVCRWCRRSSATFASKVSGGSRRGAVVVAQQAIEAFATRDGRSWSGVVGDRRGQRGDQPVVEALVVTLAMVVLDELRDRKPEVALTEGERVRLRFARSFLDACALNSRRTCLRSSHLRPRRRRVPSRRPPRVRSR